MEESKKASLVPEITEAYDYIENLRRIINICWEKIPEYSPSEESFSNFAQKMQDYYGDLFSCLKISDQDQRKLKIDSLKSEVAREATYVLKQATDFLQRNCRQKLDKKLLWVMDRTKLVSEFSELNNSYEEAIKSFEQWEFERAINTFSDLVSRFSNLIDKIVFTWRAVGKRDLILFIFGLMGVGALIISIIALLK
jgi:tRNA splicing ligase